MNRVCIRNRIDAALDKLVFQHLTVRAIYLNEADQAALDKAMTADFGGDFKLHACGYRDHIVRPGERSTIYATSGEGFAVPKRLSHRVGPAPVGVAA